MYNIRNSGEPFRVQFGEDPWKTQRAKIIPENEDVSSLIKALGEGNVDVDKPCVLCKTKRQYLFTS